jgi:hypothetical protein
MSDGNNTVFDWPLLARILVPKAIFRPCRRLVQKEPVCGSVNEDNLRWFHLKVVATAMIEHAWDSSRVVEVRRVLRDVSAMLLNQVVVARDNGFQAN